MTPTVETDRFCNCKIGVRRPTGAYAVGRALDYFTNPATRSGWGTPSLTEATDYEMERLTFNYQLMLILYRNHWIMRKIVDVPSRDMIKAWPRITSEMDAKDINLIDGVIRKTHIKEKLLRCQQWARLFGGSGALMIIEGQEDRLAEPLDLDTVGVGSFKGLIPFDRWSGITPSTEVETDIRKPNRFNLPKHYQVRGTSSSNTFEVHASRVLRFTGPPVPAPELQAQSYWGISVYEPVYEELRKRDNMSWNILNLTYRANLIGMKIPELAPMLSGLGNNQAALQRFQSSMQAMNQMVNNQSMLLLPKEGDMTSVNYTFSGVSDVYQQFQLDVAGAAEIPVTRLYGRTITGLGQSNDADEQIYEERIASDQDEFLRPQLEVLYAVLCASTLGDVPEDIDLQFPSVRVLDPKEKADLAKSVSDFVTGLVNAEIITKATALREIKQSSDITEIGTNITDQEIEAAENEPVMPAGEIPPGEEPGGPAPGVPSQLPSGQEEPVPPALDQPMVPESGSRVINFYLDGRSPEQYARYPRIGMQDARTAFAGIPINIERSAGQRRVLRNDAGQVVYNRVLLHDYGYIEDTVGRDGDEIDVIVGPDESAPLAFVADMIDLGPDIDKREDEDKVLLGFPDEASARAAFMSMYPAEFLGGIQAIPLRDSSSRVFDAGTFKESEHPRGNPENAGQFTSKGGGGGGKANTSEKPPSKESEQGLAKTWAKEMPAEKTRGEQRGESKLPADHPVRKVAEKVINAGRKWAEGVKANDLKFKELSDKSEDVKRRLSNNLQLQERCKRNIVKLEGKVWAQPDETPEQVAARQPLTDKFQKEGAKLDKLVMRHAEMRREHDNVNSEIAKTIGTWVNQGITGNSGAKIQVDTRRPLLGNSVKSMMDEVDQLTGGPPASPHGSSRSNVTLDAVSGVGRAGDECYSYSKNTVYLKLQSSRSVVFHEMGHWWECNTPGGMKAASAFLEHRTAGEKLEKMSDIAQRMYGVRGSYDDSEVAWPDQFQTPYTGKVYNPQMNAWGEFGRPTEVVSMGFQKLSEDPARFFQEDPDHFYFTIGMIRAGRAGGYDKL